MIAPAWPRHPALYEINARVWLRELSLRARRLLTLADVPDGEIQRLADLGFDALWLMGVWATGAAGREVSRRDPTLRADYRHALPDVCEADIIGSPYAVAAYEVAPELGGPQALAALRARLAGAGLRLVLDFVPNHTALDHPLVGERPAAYVQGTEDDLLRDPASFFRGPSGAVIARGRDPFFPAWPDTAQLNPGSHEGRRFLMESLHAVADECDGLRCDMAMLLLPEVLERTWGGRLGPGWIRASFWSEAIAAVRVQSKEFVFLAECYWDLEERLLGEGFDFTYDKVLYDRVRAGDAAGVRGHLSRPAAFQERCARFLENHDEMRAVEAFGLEGSRSAASVTFAAPGLKLFHEGQLECRRVRLPVHLGRRPEEPPDDAVRSFYERLLRYLRLPALREGSARLIHAGPSGPGDDTHGQLVALEWQPPGEGGHLGLVVVNLGSGRAYGRIRVPAARRGLTYRLLDHHDDSAYQRSGDELVDPGLFVALNGHQPHLFEVMPLS
jgi:glycosidase